MDNATWLNQKLILILGKGGVGKSMLARATADALSKSGKKTLLCHVLQTTEAKQNLIQHSPTLFEITLNPTESFHEYVHMKLPVKGVATLLLGSNLVKYLERAAPGVREMVVLGKLWYETRNYDHVIVDMPSTGYALTILHTPFNFANLFPGGPIYNDAHSIIQTLSDPGKCAIVTVCLPEEMPVQESLELTADLLKIMPENHTHLVMNRMSVKPENLPVNPSGASVLGRAALLKLSKISKQASQLASLEMQWTGKPWMQIPDSDAAEMERRLTEAVNRT